ncbi:MAG: alpha/beta hydrolase [Alphaproteobacteria bacterium]|nr:alpha/beta hydrolase [Alphaproteobacteria bacterium]
MLLFGHANGFAAGSYLPWLQRVAEHMPVFAYDSRGHGGSARPREPLAESTHIDVFAEDLARIVSAVRGQVGQGAALHFAAHSLSGLAALRLGAVLDRMPFASASLFEPPISPTADLPEHALSGELSQGLINGALRRRREWESPEAYFARLDSNPHFADWDRGMMAAHARATLRCKSDGDGWELACDPAVEAAGYRMTLNSSTFRYVDRFRCPALFVASDPPEAGGPPSWAARMQWLASQRVPGAKLVHLAGTSHMMLFERPDDCLTHLLAHIEASA